MAKDARGHGGPGMKGAAMGSRASDYWAAKSLASGPKSDPVDTHPAMASVAPSANHPGLGERGGVVERANAWGQYPKQAAQARAQLRSDRKQQLNKPPSQRRSYP